MILLIKNRNYNRMNFPPTVWGPFFWHTIHIVAIAYPKNPTYLDKKYAKDFYESIGNLLPCPVCREHYAVHTKSNPLTPFLDSQSDLFKWTVMLHNEVNKSLKKPTMTEEEVLFYYKRLGKRQRSPVWTPQDMKDIDTASFVKGLMWGVVGCSIAAGAVWLSQKIE
jgi:hypothetical protein